MGFLHDFLGSYKILLYLDLFLRVILIYYNACFTNNTKLKGSKFLVLKEFHVKYDIIMFRQDCSIVTF